MQPTRWPMSRTDSANSSYVPLASDLNGSGLRSKTPGAASPNRMWPSSFNHSTRPSRMAWKWACRSAERSLKPMAAPSRPCRDRPTAQSSTSTFRWDITMSEPDSIVFIIDDDAQVRSSLTNLCRSVELNVKAFSSTEEFLSAPRPDIPACLVLDVRFPGSAPSGLDFQRTLAMMNDPLPIIFVTGHGDVPMSVKAIKRGAVEFLTEPVREQELLDAVRMGIERDRERRKQDQATSSLRKRYESLTTREREIMHLVTRGLLNKQVAAELNLSEVTVKVHRGRIMQKMEAKSLADLVRMSDQIGNLTELGGPVDTNV